MGLEFAVLGPVEVHDDGEPVALGGPQQRRILAALLTEAGKVVAVERLVDAIWPDAPPDGARRTVMTYVSRLRQALGDGYVETRDPGYRLVVDDAAIDSVQFERLVEQARRVAPTQAIGMVDRALALWRGDAFGEFAAEWWALPHASRLEELRIVASEERADALIASGDYEHAVTDLEGLVAAYPLRERLVAQLMKAHEASGRQADALRAYAHYRDYLAEETGLEPSEALRALEASIVVGPGAASGTRSMRGYTLGEVLGEGAFGTVYKSTQPGVGREVAVKVIRADLADDPAFVRRFEAEAQLVAHLEHPHIVPLYDFWREPGGAYLVFRLLRGGTADAYTQRDGPWELDRVDHLVTEIGGALVAAHAAGVVHRDVKPANVLFDEAGHAYLSDFGIAAGDIGTTTAVAVPAFPSAGSPLYAAPEQFQHGAPTPSSDQYSFAAMVWELLTATPPFEGDKVSTILRDKLQRPVPSLRDRRPDLPVEIDAVLRRATASHAEDRYDDLTTMLAAWRVAITSGARTTGELATVQAPADMSSTVADLAEVVANPYKGLRAFGEADARHFYGRTALVARLAENVEREPFVAVVGPSGSGKSSLVHAGLVPRLRGARHRIASMVPGDDPLAQLRLALLTAAVREPDAGGVDVMVRSVARQTPEPLVLVVDQFEELWTQAPEVRRELFLSGLAELATMPTSGLRVVVSIRADFFDRPLAHPALGPLVGASTFGVTPMTVDELHDAVVTPAGDVGVVFEPGLDGMIISEVAHQPASLPTLQFTLAELFERRRGRVITRDAYDELGGIAGAIASRAEALYASLDAPEQDATRRLMLRLVVPGDGTEDTRRRVRHRDLPAGSASVAERFERHRLLVADRDPTTREPTIEVAHESLLRSWPRLRGWLAEDRDLIRRVQHVGASAQAWDDGGRQEAELYRGARLDAAVEVLDARPDQLTGTERAFVGASRDAARASEARDRAARRRLRRGLVATALALVVALVAASVAFVQRKTANDERRNANVQAESADVARLVSLSQSLTGTKRDIAMLLALEASRRAPGAATTGALLSAFDSDPSFLGYLRTGSRAGGQITFSADGRFLYSNSQTNGVGPNRIDLATHAVTRVPVQGLDADTEVYWFEPIDGSTAVVAPYNTKLQRGQRIERVDVRDGRVLGTTRFPVEISEFVVSPDRRRVAVALQATPTVTGRVAIVDVATMREVASVEQPGPRYAGDEGPNFYGNSAWIDDRHLVVGSPSGRIVVWDPVTRAITRRVNDPPTALAGNSTIVKATHDGSEIIAFSSGNQMLMGYDARTGAPLWRHSQPSAVAFVLDEVSHVVWAQEAGFGSSRLFPYDLRTGERIATELNDQHGTVCDVRSSPDGRTVAVTSCNEGTIALWAFDGRTATGSALAPAGFASYGDLWSADGRYVAVFRNDVPDSVELVDVHTGRRVRVPGVGGGDHGTPIFRRDGILEATNAHRHVVEVDPATAAVVDTGVVLPGSGDVYSTTELPGRHLTAYGLDAGLVVLVDTAARRIVRKIVTDIGPVYGVGWNADGTRIYAAGQSETGEVFSVASGKKLATLPTPAANLVVSPDHRSMAVNSFNGTITFYDTTTLKRTGDPLTGGTAFTRVMQFTRDGRTLVTSGLDNTTRLFDVATRRQIGPGIPITSVGEAIAPDSKEIAITTDRGVQRLSLDPSTLQAEVCRAAGRNLSRSEWRQYIGGTPRRLCPAFPLESS